MAEKEGLGNQIPVAEKDNINVATQEPVAAQKREIQSKEDLINQILNGVSPENEEEWREYLDGGMRSQDKWIGHQFNEFRKQRPELAEQIANEWKTGANDKYFTLYDTFRTVLRNNGYVPYRDSDGRSWINKETGDKIDMNGSFFFANEKLQPHPWGISNIANQGSISEYQRIVGDHWTDEDESEGRRNARKDMADYLGRFIKRK